MGDLTEDLVEQRKELEEKDHWKTRAKQLEEQLAKRKEGISTEELLQNLAKENEKLDKRHDKVMEKYLEFKKEY